MELYICEVLRLFPPVQIEHKYAIKSDILPSGDRVLSYKFMAFNADPRSCLSKNTSFIPLKIIVIALLWNFHFQVVEGNSMRPSVSIMLHMKHGLQVKHVKDREYKKRP
ncbi:hypothetical protein Ahy_B03g067898 [Arachis hypogaea]|uniref:Uncharacterized protein n=1 Tax=Arachis hypogaea TaxID=3818 RepID=A0A445A7Z9_ARAHY|nr:hypothetical protein Ahy_B03g067898 [Arachis hypogaea]